MRVASGDVGDIFMLYGVGDPFVTNGGAQDLTSLIDKYAPDAKQLVSKAQWLVNTLNGKIYGLPKIPMTEATWVMYVRKDWMDKLKLQNPKTSDDYLNMLRAFRDKDPNGNGKKDEIPLATQGFGNLHNLQGMFGVWGPSTTILNGEIVPGSLDPKVKDFIKFFKTMYDEKLLDPEFMVTQRAQWEQKIYSGLVGTWSGVVSLAWDYQSKLNTGAPEQKPVVQAINTPIGIGNNSGIHGSNLNPWTQCWVVPNKCKNPDAVVRLYNFLLTKEGVAFTQLGVPGLTYTVDAGGKYYYNKVDDQKGMWRDVVLNYGPYDADIMIAKNGAEAAAKIKQAVDTINADAPFSAPEIGITGLKNIGLKADLGNKRFPEMIAQIITGNKPLDYYDTWAKEQRAIAQPFIDEINQAAKAQRLPPYDK